MTDKHYNIYCNFKLYSILKLWLVSNRGRYTFGHKQKLTTICYEKPPWLEREDK